MKKLLTAGLSLVLMLALLAGCTAKPQVPEGMDADRLYALAKETVDAANSGDYDKLIELVAEGGPTAEGWAESLAPIKEMYGDFVAYKSESIITQQAEGIGEFAVVLLEAEHTKKNGIWQVSVTPDYKVIKLWLQ